MDSPSMFRMLHPVILTPRVTDDGACKDAKGEAAQRNVWPDSKCLEPKLTYLLTYLVTYLLFGSRKKK